MNNKKYNTKEEENGMATSTFAKEFKVEKNMVDKFVREMNESATSPLDKNFQTKATSVSKIKDLLSKALK